MDPFDVQLEDDELMSEVELTAELIVAANACNCPLTRDQIDEILGITTQRTPAKTSSSSSAESAVS